jgi:hypothetical protein
VPKTLTSNSLADGRFDKQDFGRGTKTSADASASSPTNSGSSEQKAANAHGADASAGRSFHANPLDMAALPLHQGFELQCHR